MSQTVISTGKDVMEAIELGLHLLGTSKEEVSIEVIQQQSKGFLKIGSKKAVVKLTKVHSNKPDQDQRPKEMSQVALESMIDNIVMDDKNIPQPEAAGENDHQPNRRDTHGKDLEGKVWIQDGKVFSRPSPFHYPTITACKGVKLLKNDEEAAGTTVVTKEDHFELQTDKEAKETKWSIKMDPSKLNVFLHIEPGMKKTCQIKDIAPEHHIELEAEEIIEIYNELEYKQVLEELEKFRVIHGFNHTEIMKAVNTETSGTFTIATGIRSKEGENGRLEVVIETKKKTGPQERNDGTVDFRELQVIPTVQKGQVIAIVHPPVPGAPGFTVTNEPLPAKQTFPLIIHAGKGIALIENDTKIVASETGRPVIDQRGLVVKVSIIPKLVHHSDVNISSGNIRFMGDVDVIGNVEEGMVVEADGDIEVFKNAYSASISGKSSVTIYGNAIASTISAGKQNMFTSEMIHVLSDIREETKMMILSIEQLMTMPAFKMTDYTKRGLYPLIKLLAEKKFQTLIRYIKQLMELSKAGSHLLDLEWLTITENLRMCFLSAFPNEFHSLERMKGLMQKLEEMIELHDEKDMECVVKLKYAQNSSIHSGGDVIIDGQGCYNSKIYAGGNLVINGVFRGGEVYGRLGASIKESGSETGALSTIIVPRNGTIKIDYAREGTVIQFGNTQHRIQAERRYITARLNEEGHIIF